MIFIFFSGGLVILITSIFVRTSIVELAACIGSRKYDITLPSLRHQTTPSLFIMTDVTDLFIIFNNILISVRLRVAVISLKSSISTISIVASIMLRFLIKAFSSAKEALLLLVWKAAMQESLMLFKGIEIGMSFHIFLHIS